MYYPRQIESVIERVVKRKPISVLTGTRGAEIFDYITDNVADDKTTINVCHEGGSP